MRLDLISCENLLNNLYLNGHIGQRTFLQAKKRLTLIPLARNSRIRQKHIKALTNIIPEIAFLWR